MSRQNRPWLQRLMVLALAGVPALALAGSSSALAGLGRTDIWLNHLDLLPGDPSVTTSFNAVSSGVGGGLAGLVVESSTSGEDALGGGNKVVWMGAEVPPGFRVEGVRVCYELSSAGSYVSQIRLAQVQDAPATALVLMDDGTDLVDPGPTCVDSRDTDVSPANGALLLSLRVYFGSVSDRIVIRGVALHLKRRAGK